MKVVTAVQAEAWRSARLSCLLAPLLPLGPPLSDSNAGATGTVAAVTASSTLSQSASSGPLANAQWAASFPSSSVIAVPDVAAFIPIASPSTAPLAALQYAYTMQRGLRGVAPTPTVTPAAAAFLSSHSPSRGSAEHSDISGCGGHGGGVFGNVLEAAAVAAATASALLPLSPPSLGTGLPTASAPTTSPAGGTRGGTGASPHFISNDALPAAVTANGLWLGECVATAGAFIILPCAPIYLVKF